MSADKLQQLLNELHKQGAVVTSDLRDALAVALGKLPLVSQQEFDTQVDILRRTREKLARVEAQVEHLEQALAEQSPTAPSQERKPPAG
ncbi:accessory factor UbiK family protein [Microbulbifer sp. SAOS-129_SWC]|uniref:accessory factor UbiK family protein n=1 Tax=Microbulbifer sp. SAOS-129_SWC TaxID=3145235 RepID=UPI003217CF2D